MPDETKPAEQPEARKQTIVRGSDITAILFGVPVFLVIIGAGVLNICAATGWWNPFHWHGRLWTGILLLLLPTAMTIMTTLPIKIRSKIPDSVGGTTVLLLWVAFFWAACGGH